MERKSFAITELKADAAGPPGSFEALVAVFGNVDQGGDRLEPGAFKRTLAERGLPPIVWSHEWDTPPIGVTTSAQETPEGLVLKGRLFVGQGEDNQRAREVYTAMKAADGNGQAPLREFSFGYSARDYRFETAADGTEVRVLSDVELYEAGPTLVGMNPATRLIGIKSGATLQIVDGDPAPANAGTANPADTNFTTTTEQADKPAASQPDPAPEAGTELSEDDRVRIGRLLADHPHHYHQENPS